MNLADEPRHSANEPGGPPELAGRSAAVGRVQEFLRRVAGLPGGVLLVAGAGADVESVARELHLRGPVAAGPFVSVDCGAEGLEDLLFGEAIGHPPADLESVSPAGQIAAARGGTLFLQNVGELPAGVQARLARVARDGEVQIGGKPVSTAIRLVASAPFGVDTDVKERRVRSDLYRRLATSRIDLPPLSARPDDVPAIAIQLLDECCGPSASRRIFTQAALGLLGALTWPGNLAELRHVIERVVAGTSEASIHVEHLLPALQLDRAPTPFVPSGTLREARQRFERDYIASVLQHHNWRMADAAQALGIQRPNLYRKARQLGIPLARSSD